MTITSLKGLSASQTTGLWFTIANNYYELAGTMLEGSDSNRSIVPEHEIKTVLDNNGSVPILHEPFRASRLFYLHPVDGEFG